MEETLSNESRTPVVAREHMAVDLLLNLDAARRLAPFMRCEQTLGSAAAELEMPASSLAYWVGRFQKAGLIAIVRREPRAGKPIPVYRAIADEFQVPLDAMPPGLRDEFLRVRGPTQEGEVRRHIELGITHKFNSLSGDGRLSFVEPAAAREGVCVAHGDTPAGGRPPCAVSWLGSAGVNAR